MEWNINRGLIKREKEIKDLTKTEDVFKFKLIQIPFQSEIHKFSPLQEFEPGPPQQQAAVLSLSYDDLIAVFETGLKQSSFLLLSNFLSVTLFSHTLINLIILWNFFHCLFVSIIQNFNYLSFFFSSVFLSFGNYFKSTDILFGSWKLIFSSLEIFFYLTSLLCFSQSIKKLFTIQLKTKLVPSTKTRAPKQLFTIGPKLLPDQCSGTP